MYEYWKCCCIITKIMHYCILVYYSMCCFFILHRFTWWIRQCVCEHVWKRETRTISWLSACDIRHCVRPLPTFPHTYTQAAAPLVIHHLSEKIEEGLLWSFLMEKKASKPPSPPPSPFSLRSRAGEFSLSSFSPSFVFLSPFSLCFHVLLTKGWLECFLSSSH